MKESDFKKFLEENVGMKEGSNLEIKCVGPSSAGMSQFYKVIFWADQPKKEEPAKKKVAKKTPSDKE